MSRLLRPKPLAIIGLFLLSVVVSQALFRFPFPPISIKPEKLSSLGGFELTNTMFTSWIAVVLLIMLAYFASRKMGLIPKGWQNFVEAVIEWFYGLVEAIAGQKNARRFFPLIATIFLFVIVNNWISLLPGFSTIGKIEDAHEVIEHVVEEEAEHAHVTAEDAEHQLEEYLELSDSEKAASPPELSVGRAVHDELGDLELHAFDEVGFFSVLPLALHDQTISALEYYEMDARGELPEDKSIGFLVPYFRNANTALNTTLAIAIVGMFMVEFWGVRALGLFSYAGKFFNFGALRRGRISEGFINVFVGVLEGISEIARIISFTFRLFGNMFAGEILIFVMMFLIPLVLAVPFYGLELFVGFIQAIIFSVLMLIFAVIAVTAHGEEHHEEATDAEVQQQAAKGGEG